MSVDARARRSRHTVPPQRWILGLDRRLRHRYGIFEYTSHRECLLRAERCRAVEPIELGDGVRAQIGDPLLRLHLWNEHVPLIGVRGPSMSWARRIERGMALSLAELARYLEQNSERGVRVVCAQMRLASVHQRRQLSRIFARFGFETVPGPADEQGHVLRHVGENILVVLLVLATNPVSLRTGVLRRGCVRVAISREALLRRYGGRRTWRTAQPLPHLDTGTG